MRATQRLILAITCAMLLNVCAWSQGSFGGITGRVTDPSGAAVAQTKVVLTRVETGVQITGTTTDSGVYAIPGLPPGNYRLTVSNPGFKTYTQEAITIRTETTVNLDISLTVGNATETIQVTAPIAELQTTSAEIGTNLSAQAMLDLPISLGGNATIGASGRRQIENFIFLTPGVQGNQWGKFINGAPAFSQEVLIDGIGMQNFGAPGMIAEATPPYDAVSEFKVQNTLYPAEYGNGLGVENFTLRSGTNRYHGDLFEFIRNDKLDSLGYFKPPADAIPTLRQNEFGGTFGGPFPFLNRGEHKTFFFVGYSGFRLRGGLPTASLITLPSLAERGGDFSDYPFPIYDPATTVCNGGTCTRDPFPGNIIPADRISGVAARTIALLPNPDVAGQWNNNYVDRSSSPNRDDDYSVKIDHVLTSKQQLSGAWWQNFANTTINGAITGELNPGLRVTPTKARSLRLNHNYSISANLLNHVGFGYTGTRPTWSYFTVDPRHGNETLQIPGIAADVNGFATIGFTNGYYGYGNTNVSGLENYFQNWAIVDDVTYVTGKHTVKFGVMYRRRQLNSHDVLNQAGVFNFSNLSTSNPGDPNTYSTNGNAFASFLLGEVNSASRAFPAPSRVFHDGLFAPYVEDSIKITSKWTATLGLRYELPQYVTEENGNTSVVSLTEPNPAAGGRPGGLVFYGKGDGRLGTNDMFGDYHQAWSPRIALTYSPDSKTVFRTGYGVFRFFPNFGRIGECVFFCDGFGFTQSLASSDNGVTPAFNWDQGFPDAGVTLPQLDPSLINGGTANVVNGRANKPALTNSWTFAIQRQLPFNIMGEVAYVGSRTTGLAAGIQNVNQVDPQYLSLGEELNQDITCLGDGGCPNAAAAGVTSPYAGFSGSVAQALRPFPQFTRIRNMYQPTGYNNYEALQTRIQKSFSQGLSFLLSYTLSKNTGVGNGDSFGDTSGGGSAYALNTFNPQGEKALLSYDQTHALVLSWTYELPVGHGKKFLGSANGVVNAVLGGWSVNAVQNYSTGFPIGISGGPALPLFNGQGASGFNRPNWDPSLGNGRSSISMGDFDPHTPGKDVYLDAAPFSDPAPFTFGNLRPTQPNLRAPANYNEDISVFKRFNLGSESRYFEFRAEFFNAFNRVVFGSPNANIDDPSTFGQIFYQANTPRVIQFGGKIYF